SPSTIVLLACAIITIMHLIRRTRKYHTLFSKNEFVLFFYLYLTSIFLDIILISNYLKDNTTFMYVLIAQLSFSCTALVSLLIGNITSKLFDSIQAFRSITIARILCSIYFIIVYPFLFVAIKNKNATLLFIFLVFVNLGIVLVYLIYQIILLRVSEAEVWAYGTLSVAVVFFSIGCTFLFYGSNIIAFLSERYLDGYFFFHLFIFCTVLMIHKYWYSISDNEIECADLLNEV
ncbi:hypothetical protein H311_03032, partial [Anncaliia algerae PRA109]